MSRWAKFLVLCLIASLVAACALPRAGPGKKEIYSGSVMEDGDAFVVSVNDRVTRATSVTPVLGFTSEFVNAGEVGSDTIRPGDALALTVWENVDDGLLANQGQSATVLEEVQVDGSGFIFVPYAGRIKAAGNTPERLRQIITEKLDAQTPDPQVLVTRAAGDGATVSVMGGVAQQGVYPISRPTRTLSAMLAQAGGITVPTEIAQITVSRGGKSSKIWFDDLHSDQRLDIALRGGDRILVEEDSRAFSVLGATGTQNRVRFETQTLSAIEALAQVGGLNSNLADPTGVFVFRNEPEPVARAVLGRTDIVGDQRFVYVLDLTEPNGMFQARDFTIRDDDTLYVTEAPFVSWQKTLSSITGTLTPLANYATLTN
ncbi:polysaccharide biosynthesis/export family protein [Tropicimonas sp. TH_r6]|uniref:polysaccharide biosynthesis/export family protein n=1 Tax=Tropicimonas sp. TH_r6 TaxID=3082085 RepID=UPI00295329F0|nr:polysaccharide biosynthesis/export family protein [Tropicimonas sp. TH_r6]MDV7145747.1 polysaccharide biosynthesis/export family protein [Tropicimonas sp. TH_r6]